MLLVESLTHVKLADFGLTRNIQVSKCAHTGGGGIIADNTFSAVALCAVAGKSLKQTKCLTS